MLLEGTPAAEVDVICTNNVRDFPPAVMADLGLVLLTPDDLFVRLIDARPRRMLTAHRSAVASLCPGPRISPLRARCAARRHRARPTG